MSSENNFDEIEELETDENIVESEVLSDDVEQNDYEALSGVKTVKTKKLTLCPTLIVATVIFAVTVLFFTGWKCFFDDNIIGTWTASYEITSTDTDTDETSTKVKKYSFTFEEDNVVKYHYGGMTLTGRYFFVEGDNGESQIEVVIYNSGSVYINVYFDYTISGNIFTGRTLSLIDTNGLLFTPQEESDDSSSINNRSVTVDGVKYYVCDFEETGYEEIVECYDNFKTDEKIEGSWLYEYDGYKCTYNFYDDGTFEILKSDASIKGGYTASDGSVKLNYYYINLVSGTDQLEAEFEYTINDDTLTFTSGSSTIEFTKTENKNDYIEG